MTTALTPDKKGWVKHHELRRPTGEIEHHVNLRAIFLSSNGMHDEIAESETVVELPRLGSVAEQECLR